MGPPPPHTPHYQPAGYPYPPHPSQNDYPGPPQARYSSTGSDTSGSTSLEFNPSAGSSSSSLGYGHPSSRHDGPSSAQSPYGASTSGSSLHSATSPIGYHSTLHQPPSSVPPHLQSAYQPVPTERSGSFDFTDFVVGMDANTPPASSVSFAAPAYNHPSSVASTTLAPPTVPTPSTYDAYDLDSTTKQAALVEGLPTTIAGLDLDGSGGNAGRSRGLRMDEISSASTVPTTGEDDEEAGDESASPAP